MDLFHLETDIDYRYLTVPYSTEVRYLKIEKKNERRPCLIFKGGRNPIAVSTFELAKNESWV